MERKDAAAAAQEIARTPAGATLFNYLVGKYGYSRRSTFDPDPYRMALQEGQRTVLVDLGILLDTDVTPEKETLNDRDSYDIDTSGADIYPGGDGD